MLPASLEPVTPFRACFSTIMAGIFLWPFSFPPSPEERGTKVMISRECGSNLTLAEFCTVHLSAEVPFGLVEGQCVVRARALPRSRDPRWEGGTGEKTPWVCPGRGQEGAEAAGAVRTSRLWCLLELNNILGIRHCKIELYPFYCWAFLKVQCCDNYVL